MHLGFMVGTVEFIADVSEIISGSANAALLNETRITGSQFHNQANRSSGLVA